jgi:MFS superfamily sulfate permease-like transporter
VLVGFKAGIGLVIVLDQIPKLLGIHFAKAASSRTWCGSRSTSRRPRSRRSRSRSRRSRLLALEHFAPRAPAPLVAVAAGIAAVGLFHLPVESVGAVPRGSAALRAPDLALAAALWPGALGIALMSFAETIAAARAFASERRAAAAREPGAVRDRARVRRGALFGRCPPAAARRRPP